MSDPKELIEIINNMRADPKSIIPDLEEQMSHIVNNRVLNLPSGIKYKLKNGKDSYAKVIDELNKMQPTLEFRRNKELDDSAREYLDLLCDISDPTKIDSIEKILEKHGKYIGKLNTIYEFGADSQKQAFLNLIAQDKSEEKTYCKAFNSTEYKEIGAAFGTHPKFNHCTVIIMVTKFFNK